MAFGNRLAYGALGWWNFCCLPSLLKGNIEYKQLVGAVSVRPDRACPTALNLVEKRWCLIFAVSCPNSSSFWTVMSSKCSVLPWTSTKCPKLSNKSTFRYRFGFIFQNHQPTALTNRGHHTLNICYIVAEYCYDIFLDDLHTLENNQTETGKGQRKR